MEKIVIFGTGDVGQLAHYYLTYDSSNEVVAFSAEVAYSDSKDCLGLPLPTTPIQRTHGVKTSAGCSVGGRYARRRSAFQR